MNSTPLQNSLQAWYLATRPKTLSAALTPVITATALAYANGKAAVVPALLCVTFATLMQIAANFINDLYDFQKGTDRADRLGPERACAQGWISVAAMRKGIAIVLTLACLVGLCLLPYGGWALLGIGVACVIGAFLYTLLLSYCGLGDLLVYLFFGVVAVAGTYYVQAGEFTNEMWWLCAAMGASTDTLLVLNNYRDRDTDRQTGKRTLIVVLGERFGHLFYLTQGLFAMIAGGFALHRHSIWMVTFLAIYGTFHMMTWEAMVNINKGKALNQILGKTSRNILLLGSILTLCYFFSTL